MGYTEQEKQRHIREQIETSLNAAADLLVPGATDRDIQIARQEIHFVKCLRQILKTTGVQP